MSDMEAVVQELADRGLAKIGNRGILVVVWDEKGSYYRANIKQELVPAILQALAEKLAPIQIDGSRTYVVRPDGNKTVVPKDS